MMQANSWHHKLFHFCLTFWIWKVWKGKEKIQKFEYLENEKSFLDETKSIFHSFWRAIYHLKKNKKLIKNGTQAFSHFELPLWLGSSHINIKVVISIKYGWNTIAWANHWNWEVSKFIPATKFQNFIDFYGFKVFYF